MMKGGKEEDMIASPMFPRLHVNDADKGGPRAPPRNKMALYEQLTIPSQRFNQATASSKPPSLYNGSTLVPSASSSQGGGHERSEFSSFYNPQSAAQSAEIAHSHSFNENNLRSTKTELGRRPIRHANNRSSDPSESVAECSSLRPLDFTNTKKSLGEKVVDEDDFMVPTFGIAQSKKETQVPETNRLTPLHVESPQKNGSAALNSSIRCTSSYDKPLVHANADKKSRKHEREYSAQNNKEYLVAKEHKEKSVSYLEIEQSLAEASNSFKASSDRGNKSTINVAEKTRQRNTGIGQQSSGNATMGGPGCLNDVDVAENEDALRVRSESCDKASIGNSCHCPDLAENFNRGNADMERSVELKDAGKKYEDSDTSMEDSMSELEISPDDVVGIIGPKQFWKARRAIVNQQRVFTVQVFELHRLIKVQKLIAASPHLLLEDNPYISASPQKVPTEDLPPESSAKPQPQTIKQTIDTQKLDQTENTQVPPQIPRYAPPYSVNPENKPSPWCYPSPNHWLVPVMSPSEGLIYKPYTGPCPSGPAFLSPLYGSCAPLSLPSIAGDFMSAAYGVPQPMGVLPGSPSVAPKYFTNPFGLPVEQVNPMPAWQIEQRSRDSCLDSIPRSEALSGPRMPHTSKDSELQGSTASSPCERAPRGGRDPLPLFPMAPAIEGISQPPQMHGGDHQSRVIKVVPHNPRSATESAARIFRSIQEERQQGEP